MKYFVTSLLIVIISVSATFNSVSANSDSTRPYNILILGDSISAAYGIEQEQGWVNLLNDRLLSQTENYQAVNASISGDTTIGGLTRLPLALRRYTPEIVIVE